MNEIVQFKDARGDDIMITPQDVRNLICSKATDKEIAMFLQLCKAQRLNPFIKDAYLVKYGSEKASIITGKEVFTKRANANPNYEGIEHGVVILRGNNIERREGAAVYKAAGEKLLGGWARVFVKGKKPVYCELALDEYSTGKSNWAKMPAVMIDKCAQVGALRLAFPADFQGLYSQEEMGNAGEAIEANQAPAFIDAVEDVTAVEMASDSAYVMLNDLADDLADLRGVDVQQVQDAVFSSATMQAMGAVQGNELTSDQAAGAAKLLRNWIAKAQEAADEADAEEQVPTATRLELAKEAAAAAIAGGIGA